METSLMETNRKDNFRNYLYFGEIRKEIDKGVEIPFFNKQLIKFRTRLGTEVSKRNKKGSFTPCAISLTKLNYFSEIVMSVMDFANIIPFAVAESKLVTDDELGAQVAQPYDRSIYAQEDKKGIMTGFCLIWKYMMLHYESLNTELNDEIKRATEPTMALKSTSLASFVYKCCYFVMDFMPQEHLTEDGVSAYKQLNRHKILKRDAKACSKLVPLLNMNPLNVTCNNYGTRHLTGHMEAEQDEDLDLEIELATDPTYHYINQTIRLMEKAKDNMKLVAKIKIAERQDTIKDMKIKTTVVKAKTMKKKSPVERTSWRKAIKPIEILRFAPHMMTQFCSCVSRESRQFKSKGKGKQPKRKSQKTNTGFLVQSDYLVSLTSITSDPDWNPKQSEAYYELMEIHSTRNMERANSSTRSLGFRAFCYFVRLCSLILHTNRIIRTTKTDPRRTGSDHMPEGGWLYSDIQDSTKATMLLAYHFLDNTADLLRGFRQEAERNITDKEFLKRPGILMNHVEEAIIIVMCVFKRSSWVDNIDWELRKAVRIPGWAYSRGGGRHNLSEEEAALWVPRNKIEFINERDAAQILRNQAAFRKDQELKLVELTSRGNARVQRVEEGVKMMERELRGIAVKLDFVMKVAGNTIRLSRGRSQLGFSSHEFSTSNEQSFTTPPRKRSQSTSTLVCTPAPSRKRSTPYPNSAKRSKLTASFLESFGMPKTPAEKKGKRKRHLPHESSRKKRKHTSTPRVGVTVPPLSSMTNLGEGSLSAIKETGTPTRHTVEVEAWSAMINGNTFLG